MRVKPSSRCFRIALNIWAQFLKLVELIDRRETVASRQSVYRQKVKEITELRVIRQRRHKPYFLDKRQGNVIYFYYDTNKTHRPYCGSHYALA